MLVTYQSVEPDDRCILFELGFETMFDLNMRLGEGSGAVIAAGLVKSVVRALNDMSIFDEAGITNPVRRGVEQ
jgi:nicotinate-nucleotide--dimethylbenzimidazole phosphoribosyltransferase